MLSSTLRYASRRPAHSLMFARTPSLAQCRAASTRIATEAENETGSTLSTRFCAWKKTLKPEVYPLVAIIGGAFTMFVGFGLYQFGHVEYKIKKSTREKDVETLIAEHEQVLGYGQ